MAVSAHGRAPKPVLLEPAQGAQGGAQGLGRPCKLVVVVFGGFEMLAAAGAAAVFGALRRQVAPGAISLSFAAMRRESVMDSSRILIQPDAVLTAGMRPDVLLVPSGPGVLEVIDDVRFLNRLRAVAAESRVIAGVGCGVLVLAKTVPLAGNRVTTAAYAEERLRAIAPGVEIDLDEPVVESGRVWSCQSPQAAPGLMLKIVERFYSPAEARAIAAELGY